MEYGGDLNLKHFIKKYKIKNQLIDIDIIIYIFEQICIGLNGIHNANLIHRDLKPENILINEKYEIKICDFGISKKLNVNEKYAKSSIGGSLYYLSPERFKEDKYDNKVDIYALGCILYELFTLNEYYIDKIIDGKKCIINEDIYEQKWQNFINLLLKYDYHERPNINEICNYLEKNEIMLTTKINEEDISKKNYFLEEKITKNKILKDNIKEIDFITQFKNGYESEKKLILKKNTKKYILNNIKLIRFDEENEDNDNEIKGMINDKNHIKIKNKQFTILKYAKKIIELNEKKNMLLDIEKEYEAEEEKLKELENNIEIEREEFEKRKISFDIISNNIIAH